VASVPVTSLCDRPFLLLMAENERLEGGVKSNDRIFIKVFHENRKLLQISNWGHICIRYAHVATFTECILM
jgi:hypothetical protein